MSITSPIEGTCKDQLKEIKQMRWFEDRRHQTWQQTDEQSCSDAELVVQPPYHNQSSTAVPDCPTTPHLTADYVNTSSDHPTLIGQVHNELLAINLS